MYVCFLLAAEYETDKTNNTVRKKFLKLDSVHKVTKLLRSFDSRIGNDVNKPSEYEQVDKVNLETNAAVLQNSTIDISTTKSIFTLGDENLDISRELEKPIQISLNKDVSIVMKNKQHTITDQLIRKYIKVGEGSDVSVDRSRIDFEDCSVDDPKNNNKYNLKNGDEAENSYGIKNINKNGEEMLKNILRTKMESPREISDRLGIKVESNVLAKNAVVRNEFLKEMYSEEVENSDTEHSDEVTSIQRPLTLGKSKTILGKRNSAHLQDRNQILHKMLKLRDVKMLKSIDFDVETNLKKEKQQEQIVTECLDVKSEPNSDVEEDTREPYSEKIYLEENANSMRTVQSIQKPSSSQNVNNVHISKSSYINLSSDSKQSINSKIDTHSIKPPSFRTLTQIRPISTSITLIPNQTLVYTTNADVTMLPLVSNNNLGISSPMSNINGNRPQLQGKKFYVASNTSSLLNIPPKLKAVNDVQSNRLPMETKTSSNIIIGNISVTPSTTGPTLSRTENTHVQTVPNIKQTLESVDDFSYLNTFIPETITKNISDKLRPPLPKLQPKPTSTLKVNNEPKVLNSVGPVTSYINEASEKVS